MSDNLYVRSAVDYLHVMSAGAFPGAVLGAWLIRRTAEASGSGTGVIARSAASLWLLLFLSLTVLVITGAIRLRYWRLPIKPESMETKTTMVVIKHSAFVITVLLSCVALVLVTSP